MPANGEGSERPLVDLIESVKDASGFSYRELSDRARRKGYDISHQQLQSLARDTVRKAPNTNQIEAIATALDVSYATVRLAVIEQFYGYTPGPAVDDPLLQDLDPAEREEARAIIRAWLQARRGTNTSSETRSKPRRSGRRS
jgi:hypothetical protein